MQPGTLLLVSLYRNVIGGFRIALGLPVARTLFRISAADYTLLAVFDFAVWMLGSYLRADSGAEFDPQAVPALLLNVPVLLLVCVLLARLFRDDSLLAAFAVTLASTDLLFEAVGTAIYLLFAGPWDGAPPWAQLAVYMVYTAWAIVAVLRTQLMLVPWRAPRSGVAAGLLVLMVLGLAYVPRDEPWSVPDADEDDSGPGMRDETFQVRNALPESPLVLQRVADSTAPQVQAPQPAPPVQAPQPAQPYPKLQRRGRLAKADTDGNGLLSRAEVERGVPRLAAHFDEIDANHDGQLSPQEIRNWSRAHAKAGSGSSAQFERYFAAADSDGDGKLSRAEAEKSLPRVARQFDAIDADHDGFITLEEMRAWLKAGREARRAGGS